MLRTRDCISARLSINRVDVLRRSEVIFRAIRTEEIVIVRVK